MCNFKFASFSSYSFHLSDRHTVLDHFDHDDNENE